MGSSRRAAASSAHPGRIPIGTPRPTWPPSATNFHRLELDALVVIGGDDTLGVALRLRNDFEFPVVGIPKTIDNDLRVTDFSFGFDTAVNIVTEAVDRLRTTTESHRRIVVVETMGRQSGWIACFSGMAVGADYILIPEVPIDMPRLLERPHQATCRGEEVRHRDRRRGGAVPRPGPAHDRRRARPLRQPAARRDRHGHRRRHREADRNRDPRASSWATSSAADRPAPTIASWPPAWAWPPAAWCSSVASGRS